MPVPEKTTFHYNAHGHGLSAQFRRPFEEHIEVKAAISLPITGGHGSSRVENFRFKEIVSFKAAYSHVSGSYNAKDGSYTTLITSTVEHLNILDVVTADRIVARISSHHAPDNHEPSIVPVGSKFENLHIAGCPLKVDLDCDLFAELDTFEAFRKKLEKESKFRGMLQQRHNLAPPVKAPEPGGAFLCSLVKDISDCPCAQRQGHALIVKQFGRIYLGEIVLQAAERRVIMMRLELGSPVEGVITVGEASGNGQPYPPPFNR